MRFSHYRGICPHSLGGECCVGFNSQGSLCTTVSETTVISLDVGGESFKICSSLPHAETCVCDGPAALIFAFLSVWLLFVMFWKPLLLRGYECVCLPEELNKAERPILLKSLRTSGWMIGRLETTIETKPSRQAH